MRRGWFTHQLAQLRIRTRITALMLLAALVARLLAALGIRGLAAAQESLRAVYEDRMTPVRNLIKRQKVDGLFGRAGGAFLDLAHLSPVAQSAHPR